MRTPVAIPTSGPIDARVRPPGSKSLTNRALLCASLARGQTRLRNLLDSDDTRVMADALQMVGVDMQIDWLAGSALIDGCDGSLGGNDEEIHVGNSGTTARFLLPVLATCGRGEYRMTGTARMQDRPMGGLVTALEAIGIRVWTSPRGGLPIACLATRPRGGRIPVPGYQSSQFISGMLLASPCFQQPSEIEIVGSLVSAPFVEMTRAMMARFGAPTERHGGRISVPPSGYTATEYWIEPDATAASYFFAAAAITGGRVVVEGLGTSSCQGDLRFVELLRQMGCEVEIEETQTTVRGGPLKGIDAVMGDISDTVPTLAVVALFADGPTHIHGVAHNRWKESNRIEDLSVELRRLGAAVKETDDGLVIVPQPLHGESLKTYDDHRLAMSLSLAGLRVRDVTIQDPDCVRKTYPRFFEELFGLLDAE